MTTIKPIEIEVLTVPKSRYSFESIESSEAVNNIDRPMKYVMGAHEKLDQKDLEYIEDILELL